MYSLRRRERLKLTGIKYGIGVPKGEVARSAAEAETVAKSIGISGIPRVMAFELLANST